MMKKSIVTFSHTFFSLSCLSPQNRKEFGLERFVPASLAETMKMKELRKLLQHFLKSNATLIPAGQKSLTALQAKLHYLRIIGELPSYGAKCFATNLRVSPSSYLAWLRPVVCSNALSSLYRFIVNSCTYPHMLLIWVFHVYFLRLISIFFHRIIILAANETSSSFC